MQLCSQSFFINKDRNNHISIAYIDTENNVSARRFSYICIIFDRVSLQNDLYFRLVSIAKNKFPDKSEDEIITMTKNIYVYSISTINDLEKAYEIS
jgi:hypothetical protein